MKTQINLKVDSSVKKQAQKVASDLGLSLSSVINATLKQFVREKEIILSANNFEPTPYLQKVIKEARKEFLEGKTSGPFYDAKGLIKHLKSL